MLLLKTGTESPLSPTAEEAALLFAGLLMVIAIVLALVWLVRRSRR